MPFDDNEINQNVAENLSGQNSQDVQTGQEEGIAQPTSSSEQIEEERNRTLYDATHGSDRATFRDENMRFTSSDQPGVRLHFTPTQVENAREEMNTDLERRRIEEETTRALTHQEALDSNAKANEGFQPLRQSEGFKNFIDEQKPLEERAVAHQEALDSNAKANEGFQPLRQSDGFKNFIDEQKPLEERVVAHQEALDSNAKANEGFQPLRQSDGFKNFIDEQKQADLDSTTENDRIRTLEEQLRELRGENSPEQRSVALGRQLSILEAKLTNGGLTDSEKIQYFDLMSQKREIDKQINIVQQESERKRKNKEKWIKIAAGVVGVGVALATPAIGCAAVLGVTLGGRIVGKGIQSLSNKLRTKSNAIKYEPREGKTKEQLDEMDRRQKRNAWWANRLGEAGAVLIGGATGYGLGNLFEGIVGKDFYVGMNNQPTPQIPTGTETQAPTEPQAPEAPQVQQPTAPTTSEIPTSEIPVSTDWLPSEAFNASDFGWDYNQMGWLGDKVYLTNAGGNSGVLQGNFFTELSKLVPKDLLMGQESGNIVNQFLRSAYGGMNPTEAAAKAAELILGK